MSDDPEKPSALPEWFWPALAGAVAGLFLTLVLLLAVFEPEVLVHAGGAMIALVTTPFFVEVFFVLLGLVVVVWLGRRRLRREGDGWVYLIEDESSGEDGGHDAVFSKPPEAPPADLDLAVIEGLLDLGSWAEAGEAMSALPEEMRDSPRGLVARHRLAIGTGRHDVAATIEKRLDSLRKRTPTG